MSELTVRQAAERLGIKGSRVRQLVKEGKLRSRLEETPAGAYRLIPEADVARLLEERRTQAAQRRRGRKPNLPDPRPADEEKP